jgi:CheY-like chemotaxis protein
MLTALLEIEGHVAIAAYDGQSAIELAQQTYPDVVLLDIRMPEMDGYEVARALRKTSHGAKAILIAMSGLGRDADFARAKKAGFDQYLVKPVESSKLHGLLAKVEKQDTQCV